MRRQYSVHVISDQPIRTEHDNNNSVHNLIINQIDTSDRVEMNRVRKVMRILQYKLILIFFNTLEARDRLEDSIATIKL